MLLEDCDVIRPEHLSQKIRGSSGLSRARGLMDKSGLPLAAVEREHIQRILEKTEGNRTRAAEILGITRQTLINKLKMYGLPREGSSDKKRTVRDRANRKRNRRLAQSDACRIL